MNERIDRETRLARLTGVLYLVIIVCAGFGQGLVRGTLLVPGDAAATAANILSDQTLFRLGFTADIVAFLADAAVAVLLYRLLRPVDETVALLSMAFRLIAHPAIGAVNLLNHHAGLLILDEAGPLSGWSAVQREGMARLVLDLHGHGYLIAGAFFGIHCALLGWLLYRSPLFPRVLGLLLGAAAVGYLTESFVGFMTTGYATLTSALVVSTAGVGEVALCGYLLVRGVSRRSDTGHAGRASA